MKPSQSQPVSSRLGERPQTIANEVGSPADSSGLLTSSKIRDCHRQRKAVVYIRQSTPQQVVEHRESADRQYALVQRAVGLGWSKDRVEVIDEDQGHSGRHVEGRLGFQHLLAEIGLDHVGIILGLEMSRLARSNKDWHQLLELCAIFRTLLADQDGLYDPTDYNDRLLLGLKGTMSEAELHILRSRMYQGLLNKAKRGEVFNHAPIGYVKEVSGEFALDPDEQVQSVVRLIFDEFERQGTMHGLLRYLAHHSIRLPIRPHFGPNRGKLEWHRPNRATLQNLLHRPLYAGFYRWGHRAVDPRRKVAGRPATGRTSRQPQDCLVLLPDRCPAYITAERFWANQKRLEANCVANVGAPRHGPALLAGLLLCGRCGQRLLVSYTNGGTGLRYQCIRGTLDYGEPACQSLSGQRLDELIGNQVLLALQPAALELHLAAAADLRQERQRLHEHWQQQLERARYETERAARQYQAVEPENRLVARELEKRWNEALQKQRLVEEDYDRFRHAQPAEVSPAEQQRIRFLASSIPVLWTAESTTAADRQRVIRFLIERIVVDVQGASERVAVTINWIGGSKSSHELVRAVQRYDQMADYPRLCVRIREMRAQGMSMVQVAEHLNDEGFRPPKRTKQFTSSIVAAFLAKGGRSGPRPRTLDAGNLLQKGEWLLTDLARKLRMPTATLHRWRQVGWVRSRKLPVPGGHWAIWADRKELKRMERLRQFRRSWLVKSPPADLTTPTRLDDK